jgi:hypothetical protein
MSRRGRTSGRTGAAKRAGEFVFVPDTLELELVGIVGFVNGLPDLNAGDTVLAGDDEELIALVESLHVAAFATSSCGSHELAGTVSLKDRPRH